jgi:molecular chaperone HscB
VNLTDDDFALFGLPATFSQDPAAIDARWKELQREAHPDRFAAQGAAAQRVALQWSVRINEAYKRLKDPLSRAAYLCELRGAPIEAENNTAMPAEFLMEQMEWREALDDASSEDDVEAIERRLRVTRRELIERIGELLDRANDAKAAAQQVRALMFVERFGQDVTAKADRLGQ